MHHSKLLAPISQRHTRLVPEKALHGSSACAACCADLTKSLAISWVRQQCFGDAQRSRVERVRKLQREALNRFELVDEYIDQMALPRNAGPQRASATDVKNQLVQQWRHVKHATTPKQSSYQPRLQVERAHRHHARHRNRVWNHLRYPDSAIGGHHPGIGAGAYGHDSSRCVDQLVPVVHMQRDHMAARIVARKSDDDRAAVRNPIKNRSLSFNRHSSSQYRKRVAAAISTIRPSEATRESGHLNQLHHWMCRSAYWRRTLEQRVPWVISGADLGCHVLEAGPGSGLTTDLLRPRAAHLSAIEIDSSQANSLRSRLRGTNVEVVEGDATSMPFPGATFSACAAFTMLHHVPSRNLQDQLLREVWRVLKPGGAFVGSDSLQSTFMRVLHIADSCVLLEPDSFGERLGAAGFELIELERGSGAFRFYARKPRALDQLSSRI